MLDQEKTSSQQLERDHCRDRIGFYPRFLSITDTAAVRDCRRKTAPPFTDYLFLSLSIACDSISPLLGLSAVSDSLTTGILLY